MSEASPQGEPHGWGELRGHRQALKTKPSPFGRGVFNLKQCLGIRSQKLESVASMPFYGDRIVYLWRYPVDIDQYFGNQQIKNSIFSL